MDFEYDPRKSESNKIKHGIDFEEAKDVWLDKRAIQLDTKFDSEDRYLIVGAIDGVLWTVVITNRNEKIRIISARGSRGMELESYDNC